jgi:glycosyltransferase involved in cell wall biosynthesis
MHISVVSPVYKSSASIKELYNRLVITFKKMQIEDYEIILVNDGSPQNDWIVIKEICQNDIRVKGINLSRNFGQHKAISAGLDFAQGDWVIIMDSDLQDQPEEIPNLYAKALEGFDVVFGKRFMRRDRLIKRALSKGFNIIFRYLIDINLDNSVSNFSIINQRVIREIVKIRETTRSHALFIYWLGYDVAYINVKHSERQLGKSSYNFKTSLKLAIDYAISQSNKPLKIFVKLGFLISAISFMYGIKLIHNYYIYHIPIQGWTSIMVSLYFIAGLLLSSLGLLGVYVGRIFDEVKGRPIYAIKELINVHSEDKDYSD